MPVVTVADVRTALNKTLTVDDDEIQGIIDAALAEYAEYVGPLPGTVTETLSGGAATLVLRSAAATQVTSAAYSDGSSITPADLDLDATTGILGWKHGTVGRFQPGYRNVTVTYVAGDVPRNHKEAIVADVAGYFAATQRGPESLPGDGYEAPWAAHPLVLFPRIRALAVSGVA